MASIAHGTAIAYSTIEYVKIIPITDEAKAAIAYSTINNSSYKDNL